jgi:hypothetical protein
MFNAHETLARLGLAAARRQAATKLERACVDAAAAMQRSGTADQADLGYATLASICLPHKSVDRTANPRRWQKRIDNLSTVIESGQYADGRPIGLPFGSKARFILVYLTTAAAHSQTPEIELGPSMYAWLQAMNKRSGGGMTYRLFGEQARRISAMTFWITIAGVDGTLNLTGRGIEQLIVADRDAGAQPLYQLRREDAPFPQRVVLERSFWQAVPSLCCAVRLSALRQLGNNSSAIDLYIWLCHRLPRLQSRQVVSWNELIEMFGAGYRHARQMKPGFLNALCLALAVYPEACVKQEAAGLILHPGPTPIAGM